MRVVSSSPEKKARKWKEGHRETKLGIIKGYGEEWRLLKTEP
jgi:hypothetical protein